MKTPFHALLMFAITLFVGCSKTDNSPAAREVPPATDKRSTPEMTISVAPRKATFKLSEPVYFDVVATNRTDTTVTIPFLYDCIIEIDGSRYTQFPKPHLYDKDGKVIAGSVYEPQSETLHGTLCLDAGLNSLDAETGSVPLTLVAGSHSLVLNCGVYRSNRVVFTVVDGQLPEDTTHEKVSSVPLEPKPGIYECGSYTFSFQELPHADASAIQVGSLYLDNKPVAGGDYYRLELPIGSFIWYPPTENAQQIGWIRINPMQKHSRWNMAVISDRKDSRGNWVTKERPSAEEEEEEEEEERNRHRDDGQPEKPAI